MRETFQNYINGRWAERTDNRLQRENPANTAVIVCSFPDSGPEAVADAVKAAADAFEGWRFAPAPRRAETPFRAAELLPARADEPARDVPNEIGKVPKEARGDVQQGVA